jgi:WXG100 family type VII secretion target
MTQIVVSPEQLEAVATTFDTQRTETENVLSMLVSSMGELEAEWEGMAQSRFYAQWNQTFPSMTQFSHLLGEIAAELRRIAQVFRETDEQVI